MHKIKQLKSELLEELEEYAGRQKTKDDVMCIKYLASACDHLCNVLKEEEETDAYDTRASRRSYDSGLSGRRSYDDGRRYDVERGRSWSSASEESVQQLEKIKANADETTRRVIDKAIRELCG